MRRNGAPVFSAEPDQKIHGNKSQHFRILRVFMSVYYYMRARSLAILMAAFVGAFALFATPAEAGGRKYYKNYYGYAHRGAYGYYRPYYRGYGYNRPYRYYRGYGYNRPYRPYYRGYGYRPYYRGYGGPAFYLSIPPFRIAIGGGYW